MGTRGGSCIIAILVALLVMLWPPLPSAGSTIGPVIELSSADASFLGEKYADWSGCSVAGVGDVNGDGYDDILIGAWGSDEAAHGAGQTYLFLGKSSGWSMDTKLSGANASFLGEDHASASGTCVAGAGDVNGDGYDDFLIGAPQDSEGGFHSGQTYLVLGKPSGWAMDTSLSEADASFLGEEGYSFSGNSVAGVGDVNGDGYDDILIGAGGDNYYLVDAGRTYLVLGKATGWAMDTDLSEADASFVGEAINDTAGSRVAGAGDVNGDGYDDVLISSIHNNEAVEGAGQTYLVLGRASGWEKDTDLSTADASFLGEAYGDLSGISIAGAGDVNGDGYDDVLIGSHRNDETHEDAGQAYLVLGKRSGWGMDTDLGASDASYTGLRSLDGVGLSVAGAGDVNGDGYDDILIGAHGEVYGNGSIDYWGVVHLVLGSASGWDMDTSISERDGRFLPEDHRDNIGRAVAGAGDVNGDGYDDILLGARNNEEVADAAGQTYLVFLPGQLPSWRDIPQLEAVEDAPLTYDFSPHVSDPDTPEENLVIHSDSPYVTDTSGVEVTFLIPDEVVEASVNLTLSDGVGRALGVVNLTVTPVNDPPGHDIPGELNATEEVPLTLDLSAHVWDVDNATEDLSLTVDDMYASGDGLELSVLFPEGVLEHVLWLNVSDGLAMTEARVDFTVLPVNDPPAIVGIGDLPAPYVVEFDEGSDVWLEIHVEDVDSVSFAYSATGWARVEALPNGTLHMVAARGEVGEHCATVTVDDLAGGTDSVDVTVVVRNVNDLPVIEGLLPANGTEFEEGDTITFSVEASDPDGDTLAYTWSEGGEVLGTGAFLEHRWTGTGEHLVSVEVSDGKGSVQGSMTVVVKGGAMRVKASGPLLVAVLVAVVSVSIYYWRKRLTAER